MGIARGEIRIGDEGMLAIHSAVIEVEEALRLTLACHVTRVWIGAAELGFFDLGCALALRQRAFAVLGSIRIDRGFELGGVTPWRLRALFD